MPINEVEQVYQSNDNAIFGIIIDKQNSDIENLYETGQMTFRCICLSNMQDDSSGTEEVPSPIFENKVHFVEYNDVKRSKCKVRIMEIFDYQNNPINFTSQIPNPLDEEFGPFEKWYYTKNHPFAFTEMHSDFEKPITFGTILRVTIIGNELIIKEVEMYGIPFAGYVPGQAGAGSYFGDQAQTGMWKSFPCNRPVEDYSENWWLTCLEEIIALGAEKKGDRKCSWGKRYDEVCPVDGRGIIGIAHWTQESLNPLVDEIVSVLGEDKIQEWFGKSSTKLKEFNPTCNKTTNKCFNVSWWKQGWDRFVAHPKTKEIQRTTWKKRYGDRSEKKLADFGWPKTKRNLSIIAGIWNSAGEGGVNLHSARGRRTPEETLADYVMEAGEGFSRHRAKRADAINRVFPCTGGS